MEDRTTSIKISSENFEEKTDYFYSSLLKLWDNNKIDAKPEIKVLFLDNNHNIMKLWDFPENVLPDPSRAFVAAEKSHAAAIVVAQNDPDDRVFPDKHSDRLLSLFKETGRHYNIKIDDFMIFSKLGYYSSYVNQRL